jgi:hypothetical protein
MARYLAKEAEHFRVSTTSSIQELQVRKSILTEKESRRIISNMAATLVRLIITRCHQVPASAAPTTVKEAPARESEAHP